MKNFSLTLLTENDLRSYIAESCLCRHERAIVNEILTAIVNGDDQLLQDFNRLGHSLRHIYMNVHAYRSGLKFGFDQIQFDQYGWLLRPTFLETENLVFGNKAHHGEYSSLCIGRGPNYQWAYGLQYCFGTAGGGRSLSFYDHPYNNRAEAITAGLIDLKNCFFKILGSTDTTNYKQSVITHTLAAIAAYQNAQVQLTLF